MDKTLISVVIPVYREAGNIDQLISAISYSLNHIASSYEIILVDDGSPDNTWNIISEKSKTFPQIRAFRLSRNFGKEAALCAGLERARGDAVIIMDGDMQHPPSLLPSMVNLWQEANADIVEAVKTNRGDESLGNKLHAWLFYFLLQRLSGFDLRGASDFKLMSRRVVDSWIEMPERNLFFRGMSAWLGFNRVQLPFEVPKRAEGRSGWSFIKLLKLALTGITAFSTLPLHLVTMMGMVFLIFSILLGIQTLYMKFFGHASAGFSTTILLQLMIGSLLMISLGIIGEYLARIYEEVKQRPRYIISQLIETSANSRTPSLKYQDIPLRQETTRIGI
jgi:polyisoprenyl-phosphate glycosyltransferase